MVYITLTTIPTRLVTRYSYNMKECILSLLNQTYKDYEIHLNIPSKLKLTGEDYIIPEWLTKLVEENKDKLKLFTDLEDLGPVTKLVPTVKRLDNPDDIIIVVDDDHVYDSKVIEEHLKNREKYPENPVGYDGLDAIDKHWNDIRSYYCTGIRKDARVKVLQHYKTISYKRYFFEDDFEEFVSKYLTWNDDLLISAYMASKGRHRWVTFHPDDPTDHENEEEWRASLNRTFPIHRHTEHEVNEGCNIFRNDNKYNPDIKTLYSFIDRQPK